MPSEHFNDDTSICSYSVYPDKKDQRQKSDNILQTVLEIIERQEGKESVALTRIPSHISYSFFQYPSGGKDDRNEKRRMPP